MLIMTYRVIAFVCILVLLFVLILVWIFED
nr:MAG TPA: hypothetical protein [Caudoviricetes sp.]